MAVSLHRHLLHLRFGRAIAVGTELAAGGVSWWCELVVAVVDGGLAADSGELVVDGVLAGVVGELVGELVVSGWWMVSWWLRMVSGWLTVSGWVADCG